MARSPLRERVRRGTDRPPRMIFKKTTIPDVWLIEPERLEDERGFFARTFCLDEFRKQGIEMRVAQCNVSYNRLKGTLRGLHYQAAPYAEAKVVYCTRGTVFDVAVDLRPESSAYLRWFSVELTTENGLMLYIPKGCAHGFQTLEDHTEVRYLMSDPYHSEASRGVFWGDPKIGIVWPSADRIISLRDADLPRVNL